MSAKKVPGLLSDEEVARIAKDELNEDPARYDMLPHISVCT